MKYKNNYWCLICTLLALNAVACAAEVVSDDDLSNGSIATKREELALGSSGIDVEQTYQYLSKYGYFPNNELARSYPAWRPIIASPPKKPSVYDETMESAVRAYQKNMGLSETGVIDAETRAQMQRPRCGVPDGITALDGSDKFALNGFYWQKSPMKITWRLTGSMDDGLSRDTVRGWIASGVAYWPTSGTITFSEVAETSTADITVKFGAIDGAGKTLASTSTSYSGTKIVSATITFDTGDTWTNGQTFITVMTHEAGHAIGLGHSAYSDAIMYASYTGYKSVLPTDDAHAVSSYYDNWFGVTGLSAIDIAANPASYVYYPTNLWAIGTDYSVYAFENYTWVKTSGAGTRMAVQSNGLPWVIYTSGAIYRGTQTGSGTGWQLLDGCGIDIGAGADGSIWVILCSDTANGYIFKWNGSSWVWDVAGGVGRRITVGPDGIPYVLISAPGTNYDNSIWRRTSSDPNTGTWVQLPGAAKDISIRADGKLWAVGTDNAVYLWNDQTANWQKLRFNVSASNITLFRSPYNSNHAVPCVTRTDNSIRCVDK